MPLSLLNSGDSKNAFLKRLDRASESLRVFQADVLDYDTLTAAFAGCEGVFHPASPVPGDKMEDPEESTYTVVSSSALCLLRTALMTLSVVLNRRRC